MEQSQLILYDSPEGENQVEVRLVSESIWMSQKQMAELFEKDTDTIGLHLKNIFSTGELEESGTTEKFSVVQKEGKRRVKRSIQHYNLDAIISVGYRVNSKRGTQFRVWANKILKEYLVQGFSINEKRLKDKVAQLEELKRIVELQSRIIQSKPLNNTEAEGLLRVIADYSTALDLLDDYDHQRLSIPKSNSTEVAKISYSEAKKAIETLGKQTNFQGLFGIEKDDSFKGSLENIYQTFEGVVLYPSVEEKAAHLLYFLVKNHSFTDGNKRIAAFLFVWFLERNKILLKHDGTKRIADNALVALTLLIAESNPIEKETMVKVIVNLIKTKKNG